MRKVIALVMVFFVTGCASHDRRNFIGLTTEPAEDRIGEAVYVLPSCPSEELPTDEEIAPIIIGAVASLGAQFAVDLFGRFLEERRTGLNGQFIAAGIGGKSLLTSEEQCIVIVRGLFGTPKNSIIEKEHLKKPLLTNLKLADHPAFYLELKKVELPKKGAANGETGAIVLKPIYLSYAASSAPVRGSGEKQVSVVVAISSNVLSEAGSITEEKAFAVFRHNFGRLEIGKSYKEDVLEGTAASQPSSKEFERDAFNISVLVTESEKPGIALMAFTEAFKTKKSDLQSALEQAIKNALEGGQE